LFGYFAQHIYTFCYNTWDAGDNYQLWKNVWYNRFDYTPQCMGCGSTYWLHGIYECVLLKHNNCQAQQFYIWNKKRPTWSLWVALVFTAFFYGLPKIFSHSQSLSTDGKVWKLVKYAVLTFLNANARGRLVCEMESFRDNKHH
jgi:hypothetical protein